MTEISAKAVCMIDDALKPLIKSGKRIERFKIVVSSESRMAELISVQTGYGQLRVERSPFVPKGASYVIEDPGRPGRGFGWVSKPAS